ncbi:CFEM domain-containing protein [Apiospora saccharicola]|uniref:CFEM domain-containing protein n=1 Tax=Apiospora saccharicola TaxID=335842 RepID=A0ABR1UG38_9PEZI
MRASLLVVLSAVATCAASQGIVSSAIQQRQTTNQTSHYPFSPLLDGAVTKPPACSVICVMQSASPTSSSSIDPIQALCSKTVDPVVADKLQACLFSSCTLQELLQAKRFTAALCHEKQTDHGPMIMGVVWASQAISVIAIILRVLARTAILETSRFEANRWGWDDTVIMSASFANLASGVLVSMAVVDGGYGKDVWVLTEDQITYGIKVSDSIAIPLYNNLPPSKCRCTDNTAKHLITTEPIYIASLGVVKVSILLFYLRIFPKQSGHHRFRILCWIMIGAVSLYTLVHMLILIFQCWPTSYAWTRYFGDYDAGTCKDLEPSIITHGVLNMAADWIIFVMPIKGLVELKMKRAKKVLAIAVLAWGLGGSVCSIFRLIELLHVRKIDFKEDPNVTMRLAKFLIWSTAEVNTTLFCACMPMALQVVRRIIKRVDGSYPSSHKLGGKSNSFSYYGQTDDTLASRRTAATKASRRGHLSLELTNISELALNDGLRAHPATADKTQTAAVDSGEYRGDQACGDEEKGDSRRCGSSTRRSWGSAPGIVI